MSNTACAAGMLAAALLLVAPTAQGESTDVPPTGSAALLKWLQGGSYKNWPRESAPHRSMGPHKALVLTYLNPTLDRSLEAKATSHPKGAAAVKELLDEAGKKAGWAVSVKTAPDSAGGKGWYWFEILGTTASGTVVSQEPGQPLCTGCHTRGRDFVLIPHPLD
jgi:hypothetical protein